MPELPNADEQPSLPKQNNQPKKPKYEIHRLSPILQLNKEDRMLYVPLQSREYENFGLIDTGAIHSALSEAELRCIFSAHPAALFQELPAWGSRYKSLMVTLYQQGNFVPFVTSYTIRTKLVSHVTMLTQLPKVDSNHSTTKLNTVSNCHEARSDMVT